MKCDQVQEKMTAYLLGDLDAETRSALETHLETCDCCRAAAQEIEPTLDLLRDALAATAPAPRQLSAAARQEVMRSGTRKKQPLVWLWQTHPVLVRSAALFLIVAFFAGLLLPATMSSRSRARSVAAMQEGRSEMYMLESTDTFDDSDMRPGGPAPRPTAAAERDGDDTTRMGFAGRRISSDSKNVERGANINGVTAARPAPRISGRANKLAEESSVQTASGNRQSIRLGLSADHARGRRGKGLTKYGVAQDAVRTKKDLAEKEDLSVVAGIGSVDKGSVTLGRNYREANEVAASAAPAPAETPVAQTQYFFDRELSAPSPKRKPRQKRSMPDLSVAARPAADGARKSELALGETLSRLESEAVLADKPVVGTEMRYSRPAKPASRERKLARIISESTPPPVEKPAVAAGLDLFSSRLSASAPPQEQKSLGKKNKKGDPFGAMLVEGGVAADDDFHEMGGGDVDRDGGDDVFMEMGSSFAETGVADPFADAEEEVSEMEQIGGSRDMMKSVRQAWNPRDYGDSLAQTKSRQKEIIIPEIDFQGAHLEDVVAFLNEAQADFGSAESREAVQIKLHPTLRDRTSSDESDPFAEAIRDVGLGSEDSLNTLTFQARYIGINEALRIVSKVSNLEIVQGEDGRSVELRPLRAPVGDIIVRTYDVSESLAKAFKSGGVDLSNPVAIKAALDDGKTIWPDGSSVKYVQGLEKLVVGNTAKNLGFVEERMHTYAQESEEREDEARETAARFKATGVNPFVGTEREAFSTFAIDVDTAAYTLARSYMNGGKLPPAESVRTEEFVNFFDYDYLPPQRDTFGVHAEVAPSRFGRGMHLLKIGVKGRRLGREEQRQAVLTFLVDASGSMDKPDRIGLIKKALRMLVGELNPNDMVAIVQYGSAARLVIEHTPASQKERIIAAIDSMQCGGSTNLEKGMKRAYGVAAQAFVGGGENRVLVLSDGVANLGAATAEDILNDVARFRRQGITCSVFGFGMGNYDDVMLETLANKGDGTYTFVDSEEEARRIFVDDLSATLNTIASDVKIQVEFMPKKVKMYRQLGYENRQLKKEDFRNDSVDAGEVGSGQSVTALYELELMPGGYPVGQRRRHMPETIAVVRVRYRRTDTGEIEEIERVVTTRDVASNFVRASERFRLAACVAEFAEILRGSPFAAGSDFDDVARLLRPVAMDLTLDKRVQELLRMVQSANGMSRGE